MNTWNLKETIARRILKRMGVHFVWSRATQTYAIRQHCGDWTYYPDTALEAVTIARRYYQ